MTIVGNVKTLEMVKGYYGIDDNTLCIKNGESLSIGKRTLTFHLTPMVHWPETMMTYDNEEIDFFRGCLRLLRYFGRRHYRQSIKHG